MDWLGLQAPSVGLRCPHSISTNNNLVLGQAEQSWERQGDSPTLSKQGCSSLATQLFMIFSHTPSLFISSLQTAQVMNSSE